MISQSQPVAAKDYHPDCRAALIQIVALQQGLFEVGVPTPVRVDD
jgi:hypothetical protein